MASNHIMFFVPLSLFCLLPQMDPPRVPPLCAPRATCIPTTCLATACGDGNPPLACGPSCTSLNLEAACGTGADASLLLGTSSLQKQDGLDGGLRVSTCSPGIDSGHHLDDIAADMATCTRQVGNWLLSSGGELGCLGARGTRIADIFSNETAASPLNQKLPSMQSMSFPNIPFPICPACKSVIIQVRQVQDHLRAAILARARPAASSPGKRSRAGKAGSAKCLKVSKHDTNLMELLQDAVEVDEHVATRSSLEQIFKRTLDVTNKIKYKALPPHAKAKWRLHWASRRLQEMQSKLKKTETKEATTEATGVFLPLSIIIQKEGGLEQHTNILAALSYCKWCIQLDAEGQSPHQWTMWNPMTDRPEFRYLRQSAMDTMTGTWEAADVEPSAPTVMQVETKGRKRKADNKVKVVASRKTKGIDKGKLGRKGKAGNKAASDSEAKEGVMADSG